MTRADRLRALAARLDELLGRDATAGVRHLADLIDQHPVGAVRDTVGLVANLCETMAVRTAAAADERIAAAAQIWASMARLLTDEPTPAPPPPAVQPGMRLEALEREREVYGRLLAATLRDEQRLAAERTVYGRLLAAVVEEIERARRAPS